ncbi:MAG: HEAT repeat domain-containing protein [bacterium]|nr:HEAT repeat domain-containing protein [bacterium]
MTIAQRQDEVIAAAADPTRSGSSFFITILETEQDPICRWHALKAIGDLRASDAKDTLLRVLQEQDVEFDESSLHRICARAIGRIGSSAALQVAQLLHEASSVQTRIAAIDALGEIADRGSVSVLADQLTSDDRGIRLWAALSLAKIGEASIPAIDKALENADEESVFILVDALAIIGTAKTIPSLVNAFNKHPKGVLSYFRSGPSGRAARYAEAVIGFGSEIPIALLDEIRHSLADRR